MTPLYICPISHNTPWRTEMRTFWVLWDKGQVHCGIWEVGLFKYDIFIDPIAHKISTSWMCFTQTRMNEYLLKWHFVETTINILNFPENKNKQYVFKFPSVYMHLYSMDSFSTNTLVDILYVVNIWCWVTKLLFGNCPRQWFFCFYSICYSFESYSYIVNVTNEGDIQTINPCFVLIILVCSYLRPLFINPLRANFSEGT